MIAFLEGRIDSVESGAVVLQCSGIGFRLLCSERTRARAAEDEEARFFVVMQARDGDIKLYGFFDAAERDAFQLLLSVQGIGGRLALAVLSRFDSVAFARAIVEGDKASLQAVSGLGARTAQRLITELEGKTSALSASDAPRENILQPSAEERLWRDLADGLESLGFERAETTRTLQALRLEQPPPEHLNEALRRALRRLRPSRRRDNETTEASVPEEATLRVERR